jgi:hypothetical protein
VCVCVCFCFNQQKKKLYFATILLSGKKNLPFKTKKCVFFFKKKNQQQ